MSVTSDDVGRCPCGSMWFRLVASTDCDEPGQVALNARGSLVVSFAGTPVCVTCGLPYATPRQRLSVVQEAPEPRRHPSTGEAPQGAS